VVKELHSDGREQQCIGGIARRMTFLVANFQTLRRIGLSQLVVAK